MKVVKGTSPERRYIFDVYVSESEHITDERVILRRNEARESMAVSLPSYSEWTITLPSASMDAMVEFNLVTLIEKNEVVFKLQPIFAVSPSYTYDELQSKSDKNNIKKIIFDVFNSLK